MKEIKPLPAFTHDRYLSYQEALDDRFAVLVSDAVAAGWTFEEVMVSLVELADHQMLANRAMSDTEAVLEIVERMT